MTASWNSKKECRSFFKALCSQEFAKDLVQNQRKLNSALRLFFEKRGGTWGAYRALQTEAQVEEVFQIPHLVWAFPKMREGVLEFYEGQIFDLGPYGVLEPGEGSRLYQTTELQGVLVPGLSFNKNGNRLGKGKGFYDKALAGFQGIKVGVCFDFQISKHLLPKEAHDVQMDYLITESGVWDCRKYQE